MKDMEYSETLGHWIRSAPRKIRRKIFWALVADYAIWFALGAFGMWFAMKVWN